MSRDKNGNPQYSDRKEKNQEAVDISERLKNVGNFLDVTDPGKIDFFKAPEQAISGRAKVDVRIKLYNYELSSKQRHAIQKHIEAIYDLYAKWFGWSEKPKRPISIRIFGNYEDFGNYQSEVGYRFPTNRSHYSRYRREVVMIGTEFKTKTIRVLYHEASHAIMHMNMQRVPKWINEGLAEVFELLQTRSEKTFSIGYRRSYIGLIKHKLREGSLEPAASYMKISSQKWHDSSSRVENMYYKVAWSIMRYLVSNKTGQKTLRAVMNDIRTDNKWNESNLAELFNKHYPGGVKKLDRDWRSWIVKL